MEFFSPFLHSTGSLSVSWEYLALPGGPGQFRRNFSCSALLRGLDIVNAYFVYGTLTHYGCAFQHILLISIYDVFQPYYPRKA